ncbi:MAG: glycosyltransferase [archaeon]|nr:glycosyltransferase [archaeon]
MSSTRHIVLIYTQTKGTLAEYYIKSLKKKGHYIETFDSLQAPRWITKGRISIPIGKNISIQKVIKECQRKPDIVIEVDGATRHLSGYEKLDVPTVFYAIDTHLVFNFHKNIINTFDYVFVAQKDYVTLLKEVADNVFWLPLAADPEIHRKFDMPKLFDIGYVGQINPKIHPVRMRLLDTLKRKYDVIAVQDIHYENMAKVYSLSKIGFNKSIRGDLNMRVFEVMSSGTMLLTDKIDNGIEELFINKKHFVTYENEKELDELIQYYLKNEEEREKIAREGQKEVHEKHTYEHRAEQILKTVKV